MSVSNPPVDFKEPWRFVCLSCGSCSLRYTQRNRAWYADTKRVMVCNSCETVNSDVYDKKQGFNVTVR